MTDEGGGVGAGSGARLEVTCHSRHDAGSFLTQWRALLRAHPPRSPLCDADAQLAWCEAFVPAGRERILAVWQVSTGRLVGVLPLFVNHLAGRLPWGVSVQVLGSLHEPLLHELPEIVVDPAHARPALAAGIAWLYEHERWDWLDLDLRDDQPWPEPRWISDVGQRPIIVQRGDLPSVRLELPGGSGRPGAPGADGGAAGPSSDLHVDLRLGRNLKESLRRNRNRVARRDGVWETQSVTPRDAEWAAAVDDLIRLHRSRAQLDGHPAHLDVFRGTRQESFLRAVARQAPGARPTLHRLVQDGRCQATLLTFESEEVVWVSVSGVTPEAWDLSAVTGLQWHALERAVAHGRRSMIFSTGVDTAKLRWSTHLHLTHRFVLIHPRRRSTRLVRSLLAARTHQTVAREIGRFPDPGAGAAPGRAT